LTPEEIRLIEEALIKHSPKVLQQFQKQFIDLYCFAPRLKKFEESISEVNPERRATLNKFIVNGAEDYYTNVEETLLPYLKLMLAGNIDFYSDAKAAAEFLFAICLQFTRTKRARQAALSQIGATFNGCDMDRVWGVLSPLVAMSIGNSLYAIRGQFKALLVDNRTDIPFITTDQPIINLHASTGDPPDKLEFFYPLSPTKAMLFLESSNQAQSDGSISALAVNSYNVLMVNNSHEQVFSNSMDYLQTIKKLQPW